MKEKKHIIYLLTPLLISTILVGVFIYKLQNRSFNEIYTNDLIQYILIIISVYMITSVLYTLYVNLETNKQMIHYIVITTLIISSLSIGIIYSTCRTKTIREPKIQGGTPPSVETSKKDSSN